MTRAGQPGRAQGGRGRPHAVCLPRHGHFRWAAPLTSALQLGADPQHRFDLPVTDFFDAANRPPDALVLLAACDSGTIAQ
jgi:hypothetical protein